VSLRAVCTDNVLANQDTAGAKFARARFAVIFSALRWVSIVTIFAFVAVVTDGVVLADTFACHRIACVRVTITLAWNALSVFI